MSGGLTEIYQEGLRIPVVRLYRAGDPVRDIFDLLLLNMRLTHEIAVLASRNRWRRWGNTNFARRLLSARSGTWAACSFVGLNPLGLRPAGLLNGGLRYDNPIISNTECVYR